MENSPTRISTLKLISILVVLAIIGVALFLFVPTPWSERYLQNQTEGDIVVEGQILVPPTNPTAEWLLMTRPIEKFSFKYPPTFELKTEDSLVMDFGTGVATGTTVIFPQSYIEGTNLDKATVVFFSTSTCPSIASDSDSPVHTEIINGATYTVSKMRDAAMGGARAVYTVYVLPKSDRCYIIEKNILYHDISFLSGAGVTELPREYDAVAIDEMFMNLLSTFSTQ